MKFSCTRDNLYAGLAITSHVPSKNVNLPILSNVLMVASNGNIRLTATNLEIAVSCLVRGKVDEPGELTVPSKLFFDFVNLLPNDKVDIQAEDQTLLVECGGSKTKMNGLPSSDFPLVPAVVATHTFQIPADTFRRSLAQVLFSVATNESRPELSGVYLKFQPGPKPEMIFAATDSYRLAERRCVLSAGGSGEAASVIVPARTLAEVSRILSVFKDNVDSPTDVVVNLSENQMVFTYGGVELISRIIEGNYPDYQQIIPKTFQTEARLDREDFIKAVKTASLFSKTGLFDVTLAFAEGGLTVSATDATRGENTASCQTQMTGQANTVTLNYRYLLDGLQAMESETIVFQMIDGANPCLVHPAESDGSYLYIVMPIRQ